MKKRKSSLLQRMMAVLLSVSLTLGLIWSAPINVLAQGSVSGNDAEYDLVLGKSEAVSEGGSQTQGSVSGNGVEMTESAVPPQTMQAAAEEEMIMTAADDGTAVPGNITSDQTWMTQTLAAGTYTIPSGVTVTLNGMLTVSGEVTIQGGGKLVRGTAEAYFQVTGSGHMTLQNIEADGASLSSSNSLISVSNGGEVTLGDGCRIHHCIKNTSKGAALHLYSATAVFKNAIIENCQATSYGGAVYMDAGSSVTVQSGTYRNNSTTGSSQYGGGCIYNSSSTLKIYGGSYIGNTSTGKAGCIYNTGKAGTETYLYGGYFQGNKSTYDEYTGSGAVLYSAYNPVETVLNLSGNVQFCGDGVSASGVDGVFLDLTSTILRKAQISSELKYSLPLYLKAEESRVIAEGVGGYRLQKKDMKKISFFDSGSSGQVWYAKLDETNNQVILTATNPNYNLYVTYGANGGEGNVSDSREYTSGDTVTVQPGTALHRDGYTFDGWNTRPDGTGTSYPAGSSFQITDEVTLYAQWKQTSFSHSHDSITFTSWESTDSLPAAAGNYCLTKDVTMSGTWEAPAGTTVLCLNGHQVKYTGTEENKSFLQVNANATLNIYDCNGLGGTHTLTSPVTNGSVTVQGGLITGTGQKTEIVGSCIRINPGGSCNLYGGSIAGFSDTPGSKDSHGAVRVEGTFHMYGGAITHNRSGCGGGVNVCGVNAHFYLHGGSISYNYADFDDGGGICINDTGSFEMTGGEIRANKAKSGAGGIHWYNDGNVTYSVHLSGGEIIGNTTGGAAGGLKFDADPWQQFFVSGGIKITGNKNMNGKDSNLYLGSGSTIMVESSGFSQGASIGVTTESAPTAQTPVAVTGHNKGDCSQYFQSDNPAYEIRNESDTVKLALPHQHTPVKKEKVLADCTHAGTGEYWQCEGTTGCGKMFSDQACTKEISVKPVLPAQGHSYESTWKKDASGHWHECSRCKTRKDETGHSFGAWQSDASGHWKVCADCNYQTVAAAHTYDNDSDMSCNDCGWDRTGTDKTPPTGSITIDGKSWDKLSESISFDLFFNEAKQALIQGQDKAGDVCSGVDKVYYYVSDTVLSGEAVKALGSSQWKEGTSVTLASDGKCIIYVKITDKAGNAAYVSSGGLVFDATAPEISGITDGAVYRSPQTVTVTDENLKTVTVNGTEVTLTDNSFTLEAASGRQTVTAEDKAGNRSTVTAVVKTAAENVNDAKQVIEAALEEIFSGNHTTEEDVCRAVEAALEKAGISGEDVQVTLKDFEKTEATTGATGSLRGTVVIASSQDSSVTDSVELNKTIPKLPKTEAEKVAEAKRVTEAALKDFSGSNDTAEEDVREAVEAALEKAGISGDVKVTLRNFEKTEADTGAEGSLRGIVIITSSKDSSVIESVELNKTIPKLPRTEAEKVAEAKQVIEAALKDLVGSNDIAEEDVRRAVEAALEKAGISEDVTVTLSDFEKIEATTGAEGSLRGTVAVASAQDSSVTDSVELDRTIPKLPRTEAEKVAEAKQVIEDVLKELAGSNDTAEEDVRRAVEAALEKAGISENVTVILKGFEKIEATTGAEGSLRGTVAVASAQDSSVTDSVELDRTIPKLPRTEAEKVAVAKRVIEAALKELAGSNDTAEEDVRKAVEAALEKAGISEDVTVTLSDFEKTEATTDAEGSLRGTVAVASAQDSSVTDSVELDRTIPKLAESGSVIPEVKPGENAPVADISTPKAELEEMLLTDTEKQQVQDGTDIRIILEIQDAGNTVSTADQTNVEQASNGYSVGQYLNIDLYKLVGENRTDITETAKKIRIVIAVPDSLKTADSSQPRTFAVIRVHDGTAELLADLDDSADTVTIETDRFSTYAIIYQDKPGSGDGGNNEEDNNGGDNNNGSGNGDDGSGGNGGNDNNGGGNSDDNNNGGNGNNNGSNNSGDGNNASPNKKDSEPKTGDATPIELYATLAMIAGFTYLLLYFTDRKRGMTEETKKELVTRLVGWAKRGGRLRKCLALAAIFILLAYYHSIGKKICAEVEWKNVPTA